MILRIKQIKTYHHAKKN